MFRLWPSLRKFHGHLELTRFRPAGVSDFGECRIPGVASRGQWLSASSNPPKVALLFQNYWVT